MGDVDIEISSDTKDEIGDLMESFARMIENTKMQAEVGAMIAKEICLLKWKPDLKMIFLLTVWNPSYSV